MNMEKIKEIGPVKLTFLLVAGILLLILSCGDFMKKGEESSVAVSKEEKTEETAKE